MKKIFRMALVFALAGATLMYTGCSKDYSEDINKLDSDISSLKSDYTALSNELATLKSGVASLEAANSALDNKISDLKKNFDGKISEIENAINSKADKAAVEAAIAELKADAIAAAEELQKTLDAKIADLQGEVDEALAEAQKNLDDAMAAFSNELRALVFVPDFYFAGIEATSYDFINVNPLVAMKNNADVTYTIDEADYVVAKSAPLFFTAKVSEDKQSTAYELGQIGIAKYDVNPSAFSLDNAKWAFNKMDKKYITKDEEEPEWLPVFEGISYNEDGYAEALFSIENPECLVATTQGDETNVPVMQLEATLEDGKAVSSDWAAIIIDREQFEMLSFEKDSDYETIDESCSDDKYNDPGKHLYATVEEALENDPSVPVVYNGGAIDLDEIVYIHVANADWDITEYSISELQAKYPDFKLEYSLVPYKVGSQKTQEDAYGKIDGSMFTPCWVDENSESIEIEEKSTDGISAVGRMPVVLATLKDANDDIVLYGWFKIEIVAAAKKTDITPIDLKDFGKLPYLCNTEASTTWYEFSAKVLEALQSDYDQFLKTYKIETAEGLEALEQGKTYEAQIFVKNGDKYEIAYKLDDEGEPTEDELPLGTVTYTVDKKGNTVNDKISWTFDSAAAANIAEVGDIYIKFMLNEYTGVAFKLSAEIAEPAEITYGKINPAYWFEDVEAGVQNTVRANVLVPQITDDVVTNFTKDIDDYFDGNTVNVQLKDAADPVYAKYFDGEDDDDVITTYTYKFAKEQPVIDGKPLYVSADGMTLRLPQDKDGDGEYDTDEDGNYINGSDIAKISGTSIKYNTTYWAKYLLNLWGKEETDPEKMLYANVQVDYVAGDGEECVIAEGSDVFHIRFIRPLSVVEKASDDLADARPGGDVIYLGNLVNAIDWNDNEPDQLWSFVKNEAKVVNTNGDTPKVKADGFYADTYKTVANKDIIWFNYYGINTITVNADKVETDQTGEWKLLKEVNAAAKAYLAQLNGDKFEEVEGGKATGLTADTASPFQIPGLTEYVFFYENNQGVVKDFQLKVPVSIEYSWGTLKAQVIIPVKHTYDEPTTPETPAGE